VEVLRISSMDDVYAKFIKRMNPTRYGTLSLSLSCKRSFWLFCSTQNGKWFLMLLVFFSPKLLELWVMYLTIGNEMKRILALWKLLLLLISTSELASFIFHMMVVLGIC
jgi:hypothetical protein